MKQNRPKVDLGYVYGMYGGIGYPGYHMDTEASKELFRLLRYCFRLIWRSLKRSYKIYMATFERNPMSFTNQF